MVTGLPNVALSIRQPWAWLIVNGWKDIENRTWSTRFRGEVLIHAGARIERDAVEDLAERLNPCNGDPMPDAFAFPDAYACGGMVGVAEIVACVESSSSPWFCGPYGFLIRNARPIEFIPCKGALGFFKPDYTMPPPGEARRKKPKTPDLFEGA